MTAIKWTEKYRPRNLNEVVGNGKATKDLYVWAKSWVNDSPENKAIILYGPAGVGKTSAALALASEFDWDHIEMNASDDRTAIAIEKVAGSASKMKTFSGKKRLIILDEADNLYGKVDRGGTAAMLKLVKSTDQPVILIANDYYDISKNLRDACFGIRFRRIRKSTIAAVLRTICKKESAKCTPELIDQIVNMSGGDLRSAVNDLQAAFEGVELNSEEIATAERDAKSTIFDGLAKIFRGTSLKEAVQASYYLDESPEDLIHWIDENLPLVYRGEDLAQGFDSLSRADIFLGRTRKRQNYGLWRYASFMMTGAIFASRTERKSRYVAFQPPRLWRRMGQTRNARKIRDSAAAKIGKHCHVSSRRAKTNLMEFFGILLKKKELASKAVALLDFTPEEIAYLIGSKSTTKKVSRIYEESRQILESERIADIELSWGVPSEKNTDEPDQAESQRSLFEF
ncbi:MAG: replication factor C large subunit [Methanotrichaceae archaeon]